MHANTEATTGTFDIPRNSLENSFTSVDFPVSWITSALFPRTIVSALESSSAVDWEVYLSTPDDVIADIPVIYGLGSRIPDHQLIQD